MEISLGSVEQIEDLAVLFDQYRVFYQQSSDVEAAKEFLNARFQHQDSVIILAKEIGEIAGFVQLYPSFSSVSLKPIWILNDLYVKADYRRKGVAKLLLQATEEYARKTSAIRIVLSTQVSNLAAQTLYESQEFIKNDKFYHYAKSIK